jgi:hypothetical protein
MWIGARFCSAFPASGLLLLPGAVFAQTASSVSIEEQEHFLAAAEVVEIQRLAQGVTGSQRATLSDGSLTHDAHIQTIDEFRTTAPTASGYEANFRDSFKFNVAAYRMNRMLGLDMIPATVARRIDDRPGSVTWWLDDVLMAEKDRYLKKIEPPDSEAWNKQIFIVRVFDQLIHNTDRNLGNLMITKDWKLWMIDHTRSFRISDKLENPKQLSICERGLLAAMRKLDRPSLDRQMEGVLTEAEIGALLARRDVIVRFFNEAIAEKGEESVLYDLAANSEN